MEEVLVRICFPHGSGGIALNLPVNAATLRWAQPTP